MVLSTKDDMLLPIGQVKNKLVFGRHWSNFFTCKIPKHVIE